MLVLTALFLFVGDARAKAEEVLIFAAASTKSALDEVTAAFERETGHSVSVAYAGSSALARQIALGAPADLFFSANTSWMDHVAEAGLIQPDTRRDLLGNRLVLIGAGGTNLIDETGAVPDLEEILDGGRLAMALVEAVPAGIYGKAALQSLGQWDAIAPLIAQTDNVRAALALVAVGAAPLGIVYATDVMAEPRVGLVATFPEDSHPPIRYPIAALNAKPAPRAFLDFLITDEARALFEAQGFTVLD